MVLTKMRAPDDLVLDQVGAQRPLGLVGDEVGREEQRQDDRRFGDRGDDAHERQGDDARGRGGDERQAAARSRRS